MIRFAPLLLLLCSIGFAVSGSDHTFVIAVDRSAGFTPRQTKAMAFYRFTVARNGDWAFEPLGGEGKKKGRLSGDDLETWVEDIEHGLYEVQSDPELGARDEPYMDLTVNDKRVRIRLTEKLAQAVEKKIVEIVKPDE